MPPAFPGGLAANSDLLTDLLPGGAVGPAETADNRVYGVFGLVDSCEGGGEVVAVDDCGKVDLFHGVKYSLTAWFVKGFLTGGV